MYSRCDCATRVTRARRRSWIRPFEKSNAPDFGAPLLLLGGELVVLLLAHRRLHVGDDELVELALPRERRRRAVREGDSADALPNADRARVRQRRCRSGLAVLRRVRLVQRRERVPHRVEHALLDRERLGLRRLVADLGDAGAAPVAPRAALLFDLHDGPDVLLLIPRRAVHRGRRDALRVPERDARDLVVQRRHLAAQVAAELGVGQLHALFLKLLGHDRVGRRCKNLSTTTRRWSMVETSK